MSKQYEIMYILPVMADEAVQKVVNKFDDVINSNQGKVQKSDVWGRKSLAYNLNDNTEGIYVLTTFKAVPACVKELDRVMRIDENILRHMIISKGC